MNPDTKIFIAGASGLVGSALVRALKARGHERLLTPGREELNLLDQSAVASFFRRERPEVVFMAAGKTGGIYANNTYRADFIYENTMMQANVIHNAFVSGVSKLLFFGCSSIYPKGCPLPMREEMLLSGSLEGTNEPFSLAKLNGLKMCESYNRQYGTDFISVIPTNVYGPGQDYTEMNSLVVPSLISKFHAARVNGEPRVTLWGSGQPVRDFIYSDDLANASLAIMDSYTGNLPVNIATGREYSIAELAMIIKQVVGYEGEVHFDTSFPDGVHSKLQDISTLRALGWKPQVDMEEGIRRNYADFLRHHRGSAKPVERMQSTEKDRQQLSAIVSRHQREIHKDQPEEYGGKVVLKPWGHEFLIYQNKDVAVWFLHIHPGHATSMHCHPGKLTSLAMLKGEALCSTFASRRTVAGGDAIVIDKGVFHSTKAISDNPIELIEIETPVDKVDLVRLEDNYGREDAGYEGHSRMISDNVAEFSHFELGEGPDDLAGYQALHGRWRIDVEHFATAEDFEQHFTAQPRALYSPCRMPLCDASGNMLVEVGALQSGRWLAEMGSLCTSGENTLLRVTVEG